MEHKPSLRLSNAAIFPKESRSEILREVSFEVNPGEMLYLVGRVGSGKSSLLRTLYGDLPLRVGQGEIAGFMLHTLARRDVPQLRRRLGVVFQESSLLTDFTVYHNLEFVLRATDWRDSRAMNARIAKVLDATQMAHKAHSMPHELSGGERQRAAIARALLNSPQIILADEPTANLDPASTSQIMSLFCDIAAQGCTVVISTHNLQNVRQYPARTLLLDGGYVSTLDPDRM